MGWTAFRLLSSHKSPQLINLRPSTPEIETEEEIVYPLQSLERQRILLSHILALFLINLNLGHGQRADIISLSSTKPKRCG